MVIPNGTVPPTYFDTLRIPVRAGRNFAPDEAQGNVIVSEGLAQRFWPEGGAVGRRFRMSSQSPWLTVVGVVGSVQASGGSHAPTTLQFYYPLVPRPQVAAAKPPAAATAPPRRSYSYSILTVRADNPSAAVQHIKEQIWSLDRDQPVERVAVVEDKYAEMFAKERFVLQLMGAFALVALVLTAAGIFGVLSQVVAERRRPPSASRAHSRWSRRCRRFSTASSRRILSALAW